VTLRNNTLHGRGKQKEQIQESKEKLSPFTKRSLIVDDDSDIIFTFKKPLKMQIELTAGFLFMSIHPMTIIKHPHTK
jgi:hypothetical protein